MAKRNRKIDEQDMHFLILQILSKKPDTSQRDIARQIGLSLGGVSYCVRALMDKGYIKLANFRASPNKLGYVYVLTPDGVARRAQLAVRFLERKMKEYQALAQEIEQIALEIAAGKDP